MFVKKAKRNLGPAGAFDRISNAIQDKYVNPWKIL
jgi:hypothetical protein